MNLQFTPSWLRKHAANDVFEGCELTAGQSEFIEPEPEDRIATIRRFSKLTILLTALNCAMVAVIFAALLAVLLVFG